MKRMRVLMTASVPPSKTSGVGNVEHNLIEGLRNSGVHVEEYFPRMKSVVLTDFLKGITLYSRHGQGCDVIHAHTDISWNTREAVRTFHGVSALGEKYYYEEKPHALMPSHKQKAYFVAHKALEAACARRNKCIAVSNYVKDALIEFCGADEENVTTIYNGIDADEFAPNPAQGRLFRQKYGIKRDEFLLTWVGHSEFNKGIHYLIGLMNELAHQKVKARLALRCPLDKKALHERGMTHEALDNTILVGVEPTLAGFYNASDAHLLTSVYEPFCLTLLEAMSCGKPVVASRSGGHAEVIPRTAGFITPLRGIHSMLNAVERLVESEGLRKRMGEAARKTILSGFTKEHMVENTIAYYEKLVARR